LSLLALQTSMAALLVHPSRQSKQSKLTEYFSPPPQSANSIKSNHLVQMKKKQKSNKKPNENISPKSTSSDSTQITGTGKPHTHWLFGANNLNLNGNHKKKETDEYTHLIAFDFDQTLSCFQVFAGNRRPAIDLFGGQYRVDLIDQFLSYLKSESAKNGDRYRIIIISYNLAYIIRRRLKELNLAHHFEQIYDRKDVDKHGGYKKGKGNLLQSLAEKWKVDLQANTLIIDDCADVLWYAHCKTVQVSTSKGMHKYEMQEMCRKLQLNIPAFISSV